MAEAVESEELVLRVADEYTPPPPPPPNPGPYENKHKHAKGKGENAPTLGLPKCILLTKDSRDVEGYGVEPWPADFNEHDGGVIEDLGDEGVVYKVNYDNAYHLKYRLHLLPFFGKKTVTQISSGMV